MHILFFLFIMLISYLCGSVCSAIIVSRLFGLPDPRSEGSKNPGATNVLRLAGKKYASIVLLADILKGLIPVVFARLLGADLMTVSFACFFAVLGHIYPVFFGFKGGKGVATALGALLGLNLLLGILVLATWIVVARFSRYSSLASIISTAFAPFYAIVLVGYVEALPPLFFITIFILYQHRDNISRLIDGTEPKVGIKKHEIAEIIDEAITSSAEGAPLPKTSSSPKSASDRPAKPTQVKPQEAKKPEDKKAQGKKPEPKKAPHPKSVAKKSTSKTPVVKPKKSS